MANQQTTIDGVKKRTLKDYLNSFGVLLSLLLLCVILTIVSPQFLTVGNMMNVAVQARRMTLGGSKTP